MTRIRMCMMGLLVLSTQVSANETKFSYDCYLDTNRGEQWVKNVGAMTEANAKIYAKGAIQETITPIKVYNVTCRKDTALVISSLKVK